LSFNMYNSNDINFWSGASHTMALVGNNVGIGTDSPDLTGFGWNCLSVVGGTTAGDAGVLELGSPTTNANAQNLGIIAFMDGTTRNAQIDVQRATSTSTSNMSFYTNGGSGIEERMRITSGGDVLIATIAKETQGITLYGTGANGFYIKTTGTCGYLVTNSGTVGGTTGNFLTLYNNNVSVGSIVLNGANNVVYNTSSDYRLKEDLKDFAGLDMVSKIPVYDYAWKSDGWRNYGVMAHELQEVLPQAVTGVKDAVNEDGTINPQEVDYSKIVPLLVKSIQELTAKVDKLEQECKCK